MNLNLSSSITHTKRYHLDYLIIWISHNRLHKHQSNGAQGIPDQFPQSSRHRKTMSLNNQCAIQQLSPTPLAKQYTDNLNWGYLHTKFKNKLHKIVNYISNSVNLCM